MAESDTNTVSISSKWGGFSLGGKDALDIFLFLAILGLSGLTVYEHIQRSAEHDTISCLIKLNLYMQTQSTEKPINWRGMPVDTFSCVPRFIYERDTTLPRQ